MSRNRLHAGFSADTFRARRENVFARLDGGSMVLPAAPVRVRSGDSEYRYRPDSEVLYVTGLEEPGIVAVLRDHADEERYVLFAPSLDPEAEQWSGARLGPEAAGELTGADAAYPLEELEDRLPGLLHGASAVYHRLGADRRTQRLVVQALSWSRRRGARSGRGPRSVVDPGEILSELRLRKEPVEIACIRRAADVTVEAFRDMAAAVAPGVGERELEALVDARFRSAGGDGPGFATIVGSGANACVLHYVANRDRLEAGDLVLVDAGAELDYYTADITRTLPVSGAFSAEQRAVYEVVWQAHEAALGAARPGAAVSDIHHAAVGVIVEGLRDLGLLDGPVEQIVDEEAYRRFYPHQTSHWLGLDVHDPGDYTRADVSRSLEEGMVLTVEPGLYFHPRLGEIAGRWAGIGVRIEDDVLITAEGHECLTGGLPTDPGEVSALVGSRAGS